MKKAGPVQLAFMIYGAVCAGAFGLEDMISTAGPGVALLTLMVLPFLFCIPLSLAVAEITTTFPVQGGNYRWSMMVFGEFWGFQAGWWAWMTGTITDSIFAVLFVNYLAWWFPGVSPGVHWLLCLILIWTLHGANRRGIDLVGNLAIVLSVALLLPFVVMIGLGTVQWRTNPFTPFTVPGEGGLAGFGAALMIAIWLYSGYDKLSAAANEVEEPQRTFPPALFFAAALSMLTYLLPTVAALAALGNWQEWKGAYFSTAASLMGGPILGTAMAVGGLCSNALLLNVTMLSSSRILVSLAQDGLAPRWLSRTHARFGTPVAALFFGNLITSGLARFDFSQLSILYGWFQMLSNLLLYANVWALRRTKPGVERPFRVPGGTSGLLAATIPTCLLAVVAIAGTLFSEGRLVPRQLLLGTAAVASGPLLFALLARRRLPVSVLPTARGPGP